ARLWERPAPELKKALDQTLPFFTAASRAAGDEKTSAEKRSAAVRLLAFGPFTLAAADLKELLAPQAPQQVQLAAVRALSAHEDPRVAEILLAPWGGYSPTLRREVLEALFARSGRLHALLSAIEKKQVNAGQLEPARLARLRTHPDVKLRQRATKLLAGLAVTDRQKVVQVYRDALDLKGDAIRGKAVFKKTCATCHRLENEGTEVGPDLLSALRSKTPEILLVDILDPSREVDPRYLDYLVTTTAGRVFTGMIVAETASSLTLRRAEKTEDVILRNQIDSIQATAKSLMPEGLESQLKRQDLADVIAYLQAVVGR